MMMVMTMALITDDDDDHDDDWQGSQSWQQLPRWFWCHAAAAAATYSGPLGQAALQMKVQK